MIRDVCHLVGTRIVFSGLLLDSPRVGISMCFRWHVTITILPEPETVFSTSGFVCSCTQIFTSVPGFHLSFMSDLCL